MINLYNIMQDELLSKDENKSTPSNLQKAMNEIINNKEMIQ